MYEKARKIIQQKEYGTFLNNIYTDDQLRKPESLVEAKAQKIGP